MNFSKSPNLIGCHGNIKGKFPKKYSKIFSSEAVMGMKLKLCIHVHDVSLSRPPGVRGWLRLLHVAVPRLFCSPVYINCVLLSLPLCFRCYDNLNFHRLNGKSGNWHLFLCYCRYFEKKVLQKCFWSSPLPTV